MAVLTLSNLRVCRFAGLDTAVTADTTAATQIISDMQNGVEATLSTSALANSTLTALLVLAIEEVLAGELLEQRGRVVGASESVQVGGVTMAGRKVLELAASIRGRGLERLSPYLRRAALVITPDQTAPSSTEIQDELIGKSEADRARSTDS